MRENARIIIRVRPLLQFEDEPAWITNSSSIKCMHSKAVKSKLHKSMHVPSDNQISNYSFQFDKVVDAGVSSEKIYKAEVRDLIEQAVGAGRNCTVVAYGQTCAGKTYTLLGLKQAPGVIPCIFRDLFHHNSQNRQHCTFKISYTQIYNEKILDLLNSQAKNLKISKDSVWGTDVDGISKKDVSSFEDCLEVLDQGESNRKYGEKINHDRSSRSHTILKIYVEKWGQNMRCVRSVINVVDLAGSERLDANADNNSVETGHINKSLFQFSNVIAKLSQNNDQHIPFRDSKLTRLLESSLSKNSSLAIIFCLSPAVLNLSESISTLRLATKAKKVQIQNDPVRSSENKQILKLQQKIGQQEQEIKKLKQKIEDLTSELSRKEKENKQQIVRIKAYVLLDHQNFMLSLNDSIAEIKEQSTSRVKAKFIDSMAAIYEQYAQQLVKIGIQKGYSEQWLRMEDICFCNLQYDKQSLLQSKIPLLKQAYTELSGTQFQFSLLIQSYIKQIQQKVSLTALKSHRVSQHEQRQQKHISKYLNQSPIFQQTFLEAQQSQLNQGGSRLLSWGCKKDNRVFKGQGKDITQLKGTANFKDISCGAHHSLVVTENGEVYGWGKNDHKQIFGSNLNSIQIPRIISGKGIKIKSVAAGWAHSLLLSQQGKVYSFGYGEDGQLGHGNNKNVHEPTLIQFSGVVESVYAGHSHSGIIDKEGNYYAFGFNKDYRLMVPDHEEVTIPTKVGVKGINKAALGISHTCLLTKNGVLYSGGVGTSGELGVDLNPSIPGYETITVPHKTYGESPLQKICPILLVDFFGARKIIDISCGQFSTGVITDQMELYTFGKCSFDRLGHSERGPYKILDNVNKVEMGYRHGFAWSQKTRQVYAWGFNMYNQLGSLQAKDIKTPQLIHTLSSKEIVKISTGFFHSAAISQ